MFHWIKLIEKSASKLIIEESVKNYLKKSDKIVQYLSKKKVREFTKIFKTIWLQLHQIWLFTAGFTWFWFEKKYSTLVLRNTDLKCAQEEEKSYTTIREEAAKKWLFLAFQIFTRTTFVRKKILDIPPEFWAGVSGIFCLRTDFHLFVECRWLLQHSVS